MERHTHSPCPCSMSRSRSESDSESDTESEREHEDEEQNFPFHFLVDSDNHIIHHHQYLTRVSSYQRFTQQHVMKFFQAAATGNKNAIESLIEDGIHVDLLQDYEGFDTTVSALTLALQNGHAECVKILIQSGADISQITQHYTHAMVQMSRQGQSSSKRFYSLAAAGMHMNKNQVETMFRYQELIDCVLSQDFQKILIILSEFSEQVLIDEMWENILCFLVLSGCPKSCVHQVILKFALDIDGYSSRGFTPLICAILANDMEMMDYLVGQGADINKKEDVRCGGDLESRWVDSLIMSDEVECKLELAHGEMLNCNRKSPLVFAIWAGHLNVVKRLLIESDLDADSLDSEERTILIHAIFSGSIDIMNELMNHGHDIRHYQELEDTNSQLYLFHAFNAGYDDITKCLLDAGIYKNIDNGGRSVLMSLAENGDAHGLKLLLDHGGFDLNIDFNCSSQPSAVMLAAENKHCDCLKLLIDHGADLGEESGGGESALEYAAQFSDERCVELLIKHQSGCNEDNLESNSNRSVIGNTIHSASKNINSQVLKLIIPYCNDVNGFDLLDITPLMHAVSAGYIENVNLLLDHGADVNVENKVGITALWKAVAHQQLSSFKSLVQVGADVNCWSEEYGSLLLQAARAKDVEFLEILFQKGVQHINALSYTSGVTPLIMAIKYKRLENVCLLLRHGADINLPDDGGIVPVMHATKIWWSEGVQVLMDAGADLNAVDEDGKSIFFYALDSWECLKILLHKGSLWECDESSNKHSQRKLKIIHTAFDNNDRYWDVKSLQLLFRYGVFQWGWCDKGNLDKIAFVAVCTKNNSPVLFEHERNGKVTSLLQEAFLNNKIGTVRYLLANLFFTMEDYRTLVSDSDFQQRMRTLGETDAKSTIMTGTVPLFNRLLCQPLRLETLCFMTISLSLSSSSSSSLLSLSSSTLPSSSILQKELSRSERVEILGLPEVFKSKLRFENILRDLCPKEWEFINWRDDYLLALLKPVYPNEESLTACEWDCLHCQGCGYAIIESV